VKGKPPTPVVRCAIYTRKSTEEGLEQEFNSLDAQRESAEAYVASMKHEGWQLVPERYDDGGYTGGNVERPALQRLLDGIQGGSVDCVIVYKVDRLSRSLLDFARLMQLFEQQRVAFVSVTQRFDTSNSMGRLTLNMLMSFAQFEREMISERTRDKIAATRRKGKWSGGMPLLGYDVVATKLVVLPIEAERVRQIFELYLEHGALVQHGALVPTVTDLNRRGWATKQWTTKKGVSRGGIPFGKTRLHHLLTNVTYLGKIRYRDEVHEGEHEAVVDRETFERVQKLLAGNGLGRGGRSGSRHAGILSGLLRCGSCNCGMMHTYTTKGSRRYRYYVCANAQQRGWKSCPGPSLPANEIERFVVDEIRCIGRDRELVAATVAETRRQSDKAIQALKRERAAIERQRRNHGEDDGETSQRLAAIREAIATLTSNLPTDEQVASTLAEFDAAWTSLMPGEQGETLSMLIDHVAYEAGPGNVSITFKPTGLRILGTTTALEDTAA
jgi:site-specific DNA recombinase